MSISPFGQVIAAPIGPSGFSVSGVTTVLNDSTLLVGGGSGPNSRLYLEHFDAAGVKLGDVFADIPSVPGFGFVGAAVKALTGGGFAVVFQYDNGNSRTQLYTRAYSATGVPTSDAIHVNPAFDDSQHGAAYLLATSDGGYFTDFEDGAQGLTSLNPLITTSTNIEGNFASESNDVHGRFFSATGALSADTLLTPGTKIAPGSASGAYQAVAGDQRSGQPALLANGSIVVPYFDTDFYTHTDGDGITRKDSNNAVSARLVTPSGVSTAIRVNSAALPDPGNSYVDLGGRVNAVALSNGGFAVVWKTISTTGSSSFDNRMVRFFDSSGAATTGDINILQFPSTYESTVSLIALRQGGFAMAYETFSQANGHDVHVETVSSTGVVTQDIAVAASSHDEILQDLAVSPNGTFYVTWDDLSGAGTGILSQRYVVGSVATSPTQSYSGAVANYTLAIIADGSVVFVDNRPGSPNGSGALSSVTSLTFTDATVAVSGNTLTQYNNDGSALVSTFNISGQPYTSTVFAYDAHGQNVYQRFNGVAGQTYSSYEYDYAGGAYTGAKYYTTGLTGQIYNAYVTITDTAGNALSQTFTGVTGQPFSSYEYDFSHGRFIGQKFFYTNVQGQNYTGYEVDYTSLGSPTRVLVAGVTGAAYSSYENDYVGGLYAGLKLSFTNVQNAPYSGYEYDYDAAGFVGSKFFYTNVSNQPYKGYEVDYDKTGHAQHLLLTDVSGQPYNSYEYDFAANGAVAGSHFFYNASPGAGFSRYVQDYNAAGAATTTDYFYTNVDNPTYNAYEVDQIGGATQRIVKTNNDGSHTQEGYADGQTFTALGNDTFTGGMNNETFAFTNVYGNAMISDFSAHLSGAGHDTIQFTTNQFADFATLLSHTADSASGAVISDTFGDKLTLTNVAKADIVANTPDFQFV